MVNDLAKVVTCTGSGAPLRVFHNAIGIVEQASVPLPAVDGMWSLKCSVGDEYSAFLVVSCTGQTKFIAMNTKDVLQDIEIKGFESKCETLFCSVAKFDQLIQITRDSVRLVNSSSKELKYEWKDASQISSATANATQILLATTSLNLVCLEIGDGTLTPVAQEQLDRQISCLSINLISDGADKKSPVAACGTWNPYSLQIFTLPHLVLKETVEVKSVITSVLLCSLEGIHYLLCGHGDGDLLTFIVDISDHEKCLKEPKAFSLGTLPIALLHTFTYKKSAHVFVCGGRPTVISLVTCKKRLFFSNVNLEEVTYMCPFASFPDSFACHTLNRLLFFEITDIQNPYIYSIHKEGARDALCVCYQKETDTYLISTMESDDSECILCLLDGQFGFKSRFVLEENEKCSIISSALFLNDDQAYYCVAASHEYKRNKDMILILAIKDGILMSVAEKGPRGQIVALIPFNGMLLVGIDCCICLYKWRQQRGLQKVCEFEDGVDILQARGNVVVAGCGESMLLLRYEDGEFVKQGRVDVSGSRILGALQFLQDESILGAGSDGYLFASRERRVVGGIFSNGDCTQILSKHFSPLTASSCYLRVEPVVQLD